MEQASQRTEEKTAELSNYLGLSYINSLIDQFTVVLMSCMDPMITTRCWPKFAQWGLQIIKLASIHFAHWCVTSPIQYLYSVLANIEPLKAKINGT